MGRELLALVDRKILARLALIIAGVACYALAYPPVGFMSIGWLAPVFWLAALQTVETARGRFWMMFAIGYGGSMFIVYWLTNLFSALAILLWVLPATYFGLWGLAAGLYQQSPAWIRIIWPAVAWIAVEYIRCELAPLAFPFGSLGSSQANVLGFSIASIIGVYGLSGLMILIAGAVVQGWHAGPNERVLAISVLTLLASVALVPATVLQSDPQHKLGTAVLQQLGQNDDIAAWNTMPQRPDRPADLIVWPELTFADDPSRIQSQWFVQTMQQDAAQAHWGTVFGAIRLPETSQDVNDPFYNTAYFMNPTGTIVGSGGKNQPVQLMNDGIPAEDISVLSVESPSKPPLQLGLGVCYDGCFQRYSRRMVARGASLLVFPTMNVELWGEIQHRQHQRLFQFRAAETGRTVLVAAVSGPTFAAQPSGAATPRAPFHQTATITAEIQHPKQTLFNLAGWLTAPLGLAGFMLGLGWKSAGRLRTRRIISN